MYFRNFFLPRWVYLCLNTINKSVHFQADISWADPPSQNRPPFKPLNAKTLVCWRTCAVWCTMAVLNQWLEMVDADSGRQDVTSHRTSYTAKWLWSLHIHHCHLSLTSYPACTSPFLSSTHAVNTRRSPDAGTMLGQRRRRWPNIVPILGERFVFAGQSLAFIFPINLWYNLLS